MPQYWEESWRLEETCYFLDSCERTSANVWKICKAYDNNNNDNRNDDNRKIMEHGGDIVIGALGTIPEGLVIGLEKLEIEGRVKTTQTPALLRWARILRRVLETEGDLLPLRLKWKTIILYWCEKLARNNNNNNNVRTGVNDSQRVK